MKKIYETREFPKDEVLFNLRWIQIKPFIGNRLKTDKNRVGIEIRNQIAEKLIELDHQL